jgi:hypothetical protein
MQIPVTYPDGTEELGHGLDALNAYMAQYLIEGKKESSLAKQVEAYLREILVFPEKIGGRVMDIQDFGLNPPTRRIPAYDLRFIEEFEANGVSADPPPPPRSNKDGSCVICGRDFIFSPLAQSLSITYAQKSDGGVIDMKSSKTMPEDASISRTAVHIAGKYLFTYQGSALDEYFKQTKSPSQKVINLLRLAIVPGITANREMFQLLKGLEFQEEVPIQFPSNFIEEFEAESDERFARERLEMVKENEFYAPTELIIKRLKESGVWELGDELSKESLYKGWMGNIWWATVKIKDVTLVRANDDDDDEDKINIILIEDEVENYGRLAISYVVETLQGTEINFAPFYKSGLMQNDDWFDFADLGEFYHVYWGDLVRHDCATNADLDIYEDDVITMECNTCGRTATFRQETPYDGPRNAETFEAPYSCSDCLNDGDYGAESVLASVKSAETIDQAQAVLSNYSGQGMMAENLQYLNSII